MTKVLFVQPYLSPPGGGCGVAAWMLDCLAKRGPVTLLTTIPFQAEVNDRYYGTELAGKPITNIVYANKVIQFIERIGLPSAFFRIHLVMRGARKIASSYDAVFSAFDELDVGCPCVEYIHFPWNYFPRPDAPPGWNESRLLTTLLRIYRYFCKKMSGFQAGGRQNNLTLVNSDWTGQKVVSVYPNNRYRVLHPPALADIIEDDRLRREARFLSIGRVSVSKDWLKLIDIVEGLRRRGHEVGLTLAGSKDQPDYEALVRARMAQAGDWVRMINDFSREELQELMRTHDYGLHGMEDEHYGMAVAELILGGCLTMVPNSGGQVEIVTDPRLWYMTVDEAVEKWDRILCDPQLKSELLEGQRTHRAHLTKERFIAEFETILDTYWPCATTSSSTPS